MLIKDENYCTYFKEYMRVHSLTVGDEYKFYEYASWITQKHREFRKENNLDPYMRYNSEWQKKFEQWLSKTVG